ncbi:hypothetical protein Hanom_Chr11g01033531 [Helianthus anomalus]
MVILFEVWGVFWTRLHWFTLRISFQCSGQGLVQLGLTRSNRPNSGQQTVNAANNSQRRPGKVF